MHRKPILCKTVNYPFAICITIIIITSHRNNVLSQCCTQLPLSLALFCSQRACCSFANRNLTLPECWTHTASVLLRCCVNNVYLLALVHKQMVSHLFKCSTTTKVLSLAILLRNYCFWYLLYTHVCPNGTVHSEVDLLLLLLQNTVAQKSYPSATWT